MDLNPEQTERDLATANINLDNSIKKAPRNKKFFRYLDIIFATAFIAFLILNSFYRTHPIEQQQQAYQSWYAEFSSVATSADTFFESNWQSTIDNFSSGKLDRIEALTNVKRLQLTLEAHVTVLNTIKLPEQLNRDNIALVDNAQLKEKEALSQRIAATKAVQKWIQSPNVQKYNEVQKHVTSSTQAKAESQQIIATLRRSLNLAE